MKWYALITIMILAGTCVAGAQITAPSTDVLGAHLNYGRGCTAATHPTAAHRAMATPNSPTLLRALPLYGARMRAVCMARPLLLAGASL